MFRARVIMLLALSAVLLMAVPVLAQEYPPADDEASVTVSQTTVAPGEAITVVGDDFQPGSTVTIALVDSAGTAEVLGSALVAADGTFSAQVTIPADTPPGDYILRVRGFDVDGNERVLDTALAVTGDQAAPVTAGPSLARTGGLLTTGGALAALLLVVGGGAVFASRRLGRTAA